MSLSADRLKKLRNTLKYRLTRQTHKTSSNTYTEKTEGWPDKTAGVLRLFVGRQHCFVLTFCFILCQDKKKREFSEKIVGTSTSSVTDNSTSLVTDALTLSLSKGKNKT